MELDLLSMPYAARRAPLLAGNGVVATSNPLASQAGLAALQAGGSAIDAAIAAAACLSVLEPTSNGLGGDGFALIWDGARLHGINGSGRAPAALSMETLGRAGHAHMPTHGWLPVTVPGVVQLWGDMHARFGKLLLEQLLAPAIAYAEGGAPVPAIVGQNWARGVSAARQRSGPEFAGFLETFAPGGQAPRPGQRFVAPGHARTLRQIAQDGPRAFYEGEIAQAIVAFSHATGGLLRADDLAAHRSEWVEPITVGYGGYSVAEIPPNGQGLGALIALGILDGMELACHPRDSAASLHLQIEAMKLGFADIFAYLGDPAMADVPTAALLRPERLAARRALISPQAQDFGPGELARGGTVYFCAADGEGRMVSMIQSTYMGFGSGIVIPGWGIAMHNRGNSFVSTPGHANQLAPGKRPFHTIIPGFLLKDGQAVGPFGVMGGHMQPQGHTQVIVNSLDYGMHPQAALDAPRWRCEKDGSVHLEHETARHVVEGLAARGHRTVVDTERADFGRGQIIWRLASGDYVAGSESRCDGGAVGW